MNLVQVQAIEKLKLLQLHEVTLRVILEKPNVRARLVNTADIRITKHNDVLAALMVAEDSDNPSLQSAIDNLIMTAKMAESEKFAEAEARFHDQQSVLFVSSERVVDVFMNSINAFVSLMKKK